MTLPKTLGYNNSTPATLNEIHDLCAFELSLCRTSLPFCPSSVMVASGPGFEPASGPSKCRLSAIFRSAPVSPSKSTFSSKCRHGTPRSPESGFGYERSKCATAPEVRNWASSGNRRSERASRRRMAKMGRCGTLFRPIILPALSQDSAIAVKRVAWPCYRYYSLIVSSLTPNFLRTLPP